ncbi:MAG: hypothetical protein COA82_01645 [Alkaliphilus sp.]|nr:MAG: hypothetical protein COA82_01645 [Alkaliphilus sp.]
MENERIFSLIEKMYDKMEKLNKELRSEMQEMNQELRSEMQEMNQELRSEMQEMNQELRSEMQDGFKKTRLSFVKIEHDIEQIKTMTEGIVANTKRIDKIESKVDSLVDIIKNKSIVVSKENYVQILKKA